MAERYPLPDYAVSVWVAGDNLMVAFPGRGPEGKGHTIILPVSEHGLKTAINILKDRAQAERLEIGHDGTPAQYTVEQHAGRAWGTVAKRLREERETRLAQEIEDRVKYNAARERAKAKAKAAAARELEELGL